MSDRIRIPYDYVWMAKNSKDPGRTFKRYVAAFVRHSCPGYELVRIEQMDAVIKKIGKEG